MPLGILAMLAIGAMSGSLVSKGTTATREYLNKGETVDVECPHCKHKGHQEFSHIDRGYVAGAVFGAALGAIGGVGGGLLASRIFVCVRCNGEMTEDGKIPGWNADKATSSFFNYDNVDAKTAERMKELEILAKHKKVSEKHAQEIQELVQRIDELSKENARSRQDNKELQDALLEALEILENAEAA